MKGDLKDTMAMRNWIFSAIAALMVVLTAFVFEGLRRGINRPLEQLGTDARIIMRR